MNEDQWASYRLRDPPSKCTKLKIIHFVGTHSLQDSCVQIYTALHWSIGRIKGVGSVKFFGDVDIHGQDWDRVTLGIRCGLPLLVTCLYKTGKQDTWHVSWSYNVCTTQPCPHHPTNIFCFRCYKSQEFIKK